jgi:hypothetical protein
MIKYDSVEFATVNGKQGPVALTKKKQENFDQIYADNLVLSSEGHMNRKNIFFFS